MSKEQNFVGFLGKEIDCYDEREIWLDKDLVIENCPNLLEIDVSNCGLKSLTINNCPNLTKLNAPCNKITEFKIDNFPNLVSLSVEFNNLTKLEIKKTPKLNSLYCSNNRISELEIKNLKDSLGFLSCFKNKLLTKLDLSGFQLLRTILAQECSLNEIKLTSCNILEVLDLAENNLKLIDLKDNKILKNLSVRNNFLKKINIKNKYQLEELIICNNYFQLIDIESFLPFKKLKILNVGIFFPNDISYEEAKNIFEKYQPFNNLKNSFKSSSELKKKLEIFISNSPITAKIKLEQREKKKDEPNKVWDFFQNEEFKTIPLKTYQVNDSVKHSIFNLDLSWQRLGGNLIIEDWPNLKSLNVGNNELSALIVSNCPNLKKLIYSHNKMPQEAKISNCPQLQPECIFNENYNGDIEIERQEEEPDYQPTELDLAHQKQALNERVRLLLQRHEQGENIELAELMPYLTKLSLLEQEQAVKLVMLYHTKKQQQTQNDQVLSLLAQVSNPEKLSLTELQQLLTQLATYSRTSAYQENREFIKELTRYLQDQQVPNSLTKLTPAPANYFTIPYLVSLVITLTMMGIVISWCRKVKKVIRLR